MSKFKKKNQRVNALLNTFADEDELHKKFRTLILRRDKILEAVNKVKSDCDKLTELLLCSSKEDVELIIEEGFPVEDNEEEKFQMSTEEIELLVNRQSLIENFNLQIIFGFGIRTTDDSILVQLSPLPNCEDTEMCFVDFKRQPNSKLMLHHIVMSDAEEIKTMEDKYINQEPKDVPHFMNFIQHCLFCFWVKGMEADALKKEKRVDEFKIYCNKTRKLISFIFKYRPKCNVEFKLMYDFSTLYPYMVQYKILGNDRFSDEVTRNLDELKNLLLSNSVKKAFHNYETSEETFSSSGNSASSLGRLDFF